MKPFHILSFVTYIFLSLHCFPIRISGQRTSDSCALNNGGQELNNDGIYCYGNEGKATLTCILQTLKIVEQRQVNIENFNSETTKVLEMLAREDGVNATSLQHNVRNAMQGMRITIDNSLTTERHILMSNITEQLRQDIPSLIKFTFEDWFLQLGNKTNKMASDIDAIASRSKNNSVKDDIILNMELHLDLMRKELENKTTEVAIKDTEIGQKDEKIKNLMQNVSDFQVRLANKESHISHLNTEIVRKEQELSNATVTNIMQDGIIQNQTNATLNLQNILRRQNSDMIMLQETIANNSAEIRERDEGISALTEHYVTNEAALGRALADKNADIVNKTALINEQNMVMRQLQSEIAGKDKEIVNKTEILIQLQRNFSDKNRDIILKNAEIANKNGIIASKDGEILRLQGALRRNDATVLALANTVNASITSCEESVLQLSSFLATLNQSSTTRETGTSIDICGTLSTNPCDRRSEICMNLPGNNHVCACKEGYAREIDGTCGKSCPADSYTVPVFKDLPRNAFTATSYFGDNDPWKVILSASPGWTTTTYRNLENEYLQVDMGKMFIIGKTETLGCSNCNEMIKSYTISYSIDEIAWMTYKDATGNDQEFAGNEQPRTPVSHALQVPLKAQYVRLHPKRGNPWPTVRWEIYTCAN